MPQSLSEDVQAIFAAAAKYAALVVEDDPSAPVTHLMHRPDVSAVLADALADARALVLGQVSLAWFEAGASPDATYRQLLDDVHRQYGALGHLRALIRQAYSGAEPAERPAAVRAAVLRFARGVALRSSLSVSVAAKDSVTARQLAQAGGSAGHSLKRWKAHPERPTCCFWCRRLNGVTIGLHDSFLPYLGGPADLSGHGHLTQPPKPYRGALQGPGLHPRCQCELEIVDDHGIPPAQTLQTPRSAASATPAFTAAQIRAMPEHKYQALLSFITAALHELGGVLRRLVRRLRSRVSPVMEANRRLVRRYRA